MALEFIQTDQGPQKLRYGKDEESQFTKEEQEQVIEMRDKGYLTSKESEMDLDGSNVEYAQQKRLEGEALEALPVLKKENDNLKFELGNALKTIEAKKPSYAGEDTSPSVLSNIDIKTGSLSEFTKSVGDSFMNVAKAVPDKIDAIFEDPEKRKNVIRGLNILNESSGIKPISQAKSPLGSIASGLLKAEAQFTAEDIARLKAQKKEPRRYPSNNEKLLYSKIEKYEEKLKDQKLSSKAVFEKYNLARKVALKKGQLPTGIFNATFAPFKKALEEAGFGEQYDALASKFLDKDYKQMTVKDQNQFNDLFQAATFQQVVQEVKLLYPVSNKDIDTLLKTKGDISSNPEALRYLIAAQMATSQIALGAENYAYQYFQDGEQQFETRAIEMSEKQIADKIRKKVSSVTLEKMFGSSDDVTDAGVIAAFYYQQLEAQKPKAGEADPYKIFQKSKEDLEKEKQDLLDKYDPEKTDT